MGENMLPLVMCKHGYCLCFDVHCITIGKVHYFSYLLIGFHHFLYKEIMHWMMYQQELRSQDFSNTISFWNNNMIISCYDMYCFKSCIIFNFFKKKTVWNRLYCILKIVLIFKSVVVYICDVGLNKFRCWILIIVQLTNYVCFGCSPNCINIT